MKGADVQDTFPQRDRCRMGGDKFADDFGPGIDHFCFVQALATRLQNGVAYGGQKLDPQWDSPRGDPHFEKIVASLVPADLKH